MKANFKPMGIAAAVATAAVAYAGVANAQYAAESNNVSRSIGNLGDLAIVPYYTVQDDWVTGVHIINSSDSTQVVKLRLRRAGDVRLTAVQHEERLAIAERGDQRL